MQPTRFIRPDLVDLEPYQPEDAAHTIKLDANENPFDLPPEIKQELAEMLMHQALHRYPDPEGKHLRIKLAEHYALDPSQIVLGNGSDEILSYLLTAFGRDDALAIYPTPTFSMYHILARVAGVEPLGVPLTSNFALDVEAMQQALRPGKPNLLFFSYPNNPTGNCWNRDALLSFLKRDDTLVVMDEAYAEFSGQSFVPELDRYPNLVILRTFSKAYAMAGLRLGYMLASAELAHEIHKIRLPYNVNAFSQATALALLDHRDVFQAQVEMLLQERARLQTVLECTPYLEAFPTDANFILFRVQRDADSLFRHLLSYGILARNLNCPGPLQNCLRINVGTPSENDTVIQALAEYTPESEQ